MTKDRADALSFCNELLVLMSVGGVCLALELTPVSIMGHSNEVYSDGLRFVKCVLRSRRCLVCTKMESSSNHERPESREQRQDA